jgi:uncharacterized protein YjbI with pentapeptide repeats
MDILNPVKSEHDPRLAAHERFVRGVMGGRRASFRYERIEGLILRRRALDGVEFVGCDLPHAQFLLSSLRSASFYCSNLRGADLRATDLTRADMRGAVLRGADLYRAKLDGADFRKAVLVRSERDPEMCQAGLSFDDEADVLGGAVDFRNSSMVGAQLSNAKLRGADFGGAVLENVDLRGADIRGSIFDGAVLTNVNLEGVSLDRVSMEGVLHGPSEKAVAKLPSLLAQVEANDSYTRTFGASGARAKLDGEDLRALGDALREAGLVGATFKNACGVRVDFRGAVLVGAVFDGADLRNAQFNGADLRGCSFKNCNLNHADFSRADLSSFDGASGRQFPPRFTDATIHSTMFDDVQLDAGTSLDALLGVKPDAQVA